MRKGIGLWLPRGLGGVTVIGAVGPGSGPSPAGSIVLTNDNTWYDATDGDFADGGGPFEFADNDYTVEGWFKVTEALGAEHQLVGSNDDITNMKISVGSGDIWARTGGEWASNAGGAPSQNDWIHIAAGWDASVGTAYIMSVSQGDSVWTTRGTTPQSNPTNYFGFRIGDWGAGNGYTQKVAELRVWQGLRTAEEIVDNYARCIESGASGLVALYASAAANTAVVTSITDECGSNDMTRQNSTNSSWDTEDVPF